MLQEYIWLYIFILLFFAAVAIITALYATVKENENEELKEIISVYYSEVSTLENENKWLKSVNNFYKNRMGENENGC